MSLYDLGARAMHVFDPEDAHRLTIDALKAGFGPKLMLRDDERLAVTLRVSGLTLPNPVGLAAGFDKNAEVASAMLGFGFGFVECGTVTPRPQAGNPRPRLFRLTADRAVINRMGFNNDGLDAFARRLKASRGAGVIGANVGANKDSEDRIADYVAGVRAVWANCSYVTINISSPNTPGLRGLQDRGALEDLLGRVGEAAQVLEAQAGKRPVFLKVAPDLDDRAIEDICEISLAANGLTGLIVSNTTLERPATLRSAGSKESGGLSGAPLLQTSTRVLAAFAKRLGGRRDLIGAGGIANADDVLAKLAAGADAVQLYSALVFEGPGLVGRIKRDLARRLSVHGGWAGAIAALDQNQATGLSG